MSESISSETENFPPFSDEDLQKFGQITQISVRGYKSLYELRFCHSLDMRYASGTLRDRPNHQKRNT